MRKVQIMAASLATLCVSLPLSPALAQSSRTEWNDRSQSAVAARTTSMRAGPEQGYPTVRNVERGGRVTIHGCLDDRSWCDVSLGSDRGWVTGSDLSARFQGRDESIPHLSGRSSIPTVTFSFGDYWENYYRTRPFYSERYRWEDHYFDHYQSNWGPRSARSYWGERKVTGYMLRQSWLRAGPDVDYPVLRRVNRNMRVDVYGCLRDWSWCDVGYLRDRGWVPGNDIAASYQGRRQSINRIAPNLGIGILSFSFNLYWGDHYRDRSFYRERDTWQRKYEQNYKPSWGPRQDNAGDRNQPRGNSPQWQQPDRPQTRNPAQPPTQRQQPSRLPDPKEPGSKQPDKPSKPGKPTRPDNQDDRNDGQEHGQKPGRPD